MHQHVSLLNLFLSFLKVGSTAFGGFMALISVVENVFVTRTKRIEHNDMLDGISLASMLPGAVAVNVVAYVGYRLHGVAGVIVSVLAVVLPSFLLILLLSHLYLRYGAIPAVNNIFNGFMPAVTAVIVATAWNLGRKTIITWRQGIISLAAFSGLLLWGGFLLTAATVFLGGMAGLILFHPRIEARVESAAQNKPGQPTSLHILAPIPLLLIATVNTDVVGKLLVVFGGMSLMLFGGGYVFIPLIQQVVVEGYGWVTRQEFVDAIALGQITPGPILISATFIGYKVAGVAGAVAATVGIFAPSVVLMVLSTRGMHKMKTSQLFQRALMGVRPAVIGLIAAAAVVVGRSAPLHWVSLVIFVISLILLLRLKVPVAAIILGAGFTGWAIY